VFASTWGTPEIAKFKSTNQQWKANACTFGCGLRCCIGTGVWRYRGVTTEWFHTFLFALVAKRELPMKQEK